MKLFNEKDIFFCTNIKKDKIKISLFTINQEIRNYMKNRVKELANKKARINSAQCLNRYKLGPIVVSYPYGN